MKPLSDLPGQARSAAAEAQARQNYKNFSMRSGCQLGNVAVFRGNRGAMMFGRLEIFRAAAIVALIAVFITTLFTVNRRPWAPVVETTPVINPESDDLSTELRRYSAPGPQDA